VSCAGDDSLRFCHCEECSDEAIRQAGDGIASLRSQ
jgi:hypothetical protein